MICDQLLLYKLILIKNIPSVKKEQPRTKTDLAEKVMKSNGWPISPGSDRFKSFGHDELTTKHCYLRYSRPPMLMESKFLYR